MGLKLNINHDEKKRMCTALGISEDRNDELGEMSATIVSRRMADGEGSFTDIFEEVLGHCNT